VGSPCTRDGDCASSVCGIGDHGTLVCMAPGSAEASGLGGCSVAGGGDPMAIAFLVTLALLLSRGLRGRD
jgi:hypothetical protein